MTPTWEQFATARNVARARISFTLEGGATWRKAGELNRLPGVASTLLRLTTNGGKSWRTLGTVHGNPGSYAWQVPEVGATVHKCRIRVVMRDRRGVAVAAADGKGFFTVSPLPAP